MVLLRYGNLLYHEDVLREPADDLLKRRYTDRADRAGLDPADHQEESGRKRSHLMHRE